MFGRPLLCALGWHAKGNFCIHCGAQVHPWPFGLYQVSSPHDQYLNEFVRAFNVEHAKWKFRGRWHADNLRAVRVGRPPPCRQSGTAPG